jgi:predicted dehydrogenase
MTTLSLPVRVLVAGAGTFGKEHLARLAKRSDAKVVGVADTNPHALEPVRSGLGVQCLNNPLQLIDEAEAEAIIVATPAASHVAICLRALSRNLAVLLEKPVAPSASFASRK